MSVYYYHMVLRDNLMKSEWISFLCNNYPILSIFLIAIIVTLFAMFISQFRFKIH